MTANRKTTGFAILYAIAKSDALAARRANDLRGEIQAARRMLAARISMARSYSGSLYAKARAFEKYFRESGFTYDRDYSIECRDKARASLIRSNRFESLARGLGH